MKLGDYYIPEIRLMPNAVDLLDEIYKVKKCKRVLSKDLAIQLGFKYGTEGHFYRKLKTLTSYGLLEGSGSYQVSKLGESLLHPKTDQIKEIAKTKAVLNVRLWQLIKDKVGTNPKVDNFWSVLVDITKVDPITAKKEQSKILKWYTSDMELITDSLIGIELDGDNSNEDFSKKQDVGSNLSSSKKLEVDEDIETISFDRYTIMLPKGDLSKEWVKLKKYMDIKLEGYKYEEPIVNFEDLTEEHQKKVKELEFQGED